MLALVLSPAAYNGERCTMICCPMTSRPKGYVFEVTVPGDEPRAVLADEVKSLDWRARRASRKGVAPQEVLAAVRAWLKACWRFERVGCVSARMAALSRAGPVTERHTRFISGLFSLHSATVPYI